MLYYGDEFAMPGANDPDCRRGMDWDEEYQDKEMFEWYKQLLKVRKNHACIVEGEPLEIAGILQNISFKLFDFDFVTESEFIIFVQITQISIYGR